MRHPPQFPALIGLLALAALPGSSARAADPEPTAADIRRLENEIARLQQELREQRQLIFHLMSTYDTLIKSGGGTPAPLPPPRGSSANAPGSDSKVASTSPGPAASAATTGSISGRVRASSGSLGEAYVYVDGLKTPARGSTVEIKQSGKAFVPAVSVVPVGTRVVFPNEDKIFHNVFSSTPGDAFDLGTVKGGERPNPVVLLKPGHVEVFCNIHARMRADILVVPNSYWTRVRPDGSFQIDRVPLGNRRLVLWGPAVKAASQKIDVTAAGATATFAADVTAVAPHNNKQGGAYGSYDE